MEELKDVSIHHMALKILSDIMNMKKYDENIFQTVQVFICAMELCTVWCLCTNEIEDVIYEFFHVASQTATGLFT